MSELMSMMNNVMNKANSIRQERAARQEYIEYHRDMIRRTELRAATAMKNWTEGYGVLDTEMESIVNAVSELIVASTRNPADFTNDMNRRISRLDNGMTRLLKLTGIRVAITVTDDGSFDVPPVAVNQQSSNELWQLMLTGQVEPNEIAVMEVSK